MTNEQLFDLIRPIILTVTGIPECILYNPNAGSPTGSYCSVNPKQTVVEHGHAIVHRTSVPSADPQYDDQQVDARAQVTATCSINFYRDGANDYAGKLQQADKRPDVSETLLRNKVGWRSTSNVVDLSALQASKIEERAHVSIYLSYETSDPVVIQNIYKVPYSIQNESGNELIAGQVDG